MARTTLDPTDSTDRELIFAVGRVAMASAELEEELRCALSELIGGDQIWIIAEGQSLDWLASYVKLLIASELETYEALIEREDSSKHSSWRRKRHEYLLSISGCLPKIPPLRDSRNVVVHGIWYRECLFRHECKEYCSDSPYGRLDKDAVMYHADRSRMRRESSRQRWSIPQVERLADEITAIRSRLQRARWDMMLASTDNV
ncbi:hypothetical protein AB0H88_45855 [Nonomuraea sp. NPDC050680]|uniref:hypothetical protein n=1 Tax=Nonomuraea sp. NPDC050680 TaxID=3154630 RepID=UPI003402FE3C